MLVEHPVELARESAIVWCKGAIEILKMDGCLSVCADTADVQLPWVTNVQI